MAQCDYTLQCDWFEVIILPWMNETAALQCDWYANVFMPMPWIMCCKLFATLLAMFYNDF